MCLPVGGLGYSSERVRLNGCAYQLVDLDTVLSALEWVCLPVGGLGYSSVGVLERVCVPVGGLGYSWLDTVLSGCT